MRAAVRLIVVAGCLAVAAHVCAQTATPTPVQGALLSKWNACGSVTAAGFSGQCGYVTRNDSKAQNPAARIYFQFTGGSNACPFVWYSIDSGVTKDNLSGCLAAGVSYSMPVVGPGRVGVSVATTPTPNATPISVIVSVSGDEQMRVYGATPTATPTPTP